VTIFSCGLKNDKTGENHGGTSRERKGPKEGNVGKKKAGWDKKEAFKKEADECGGTSAPKGRI